MQSNLLETLAVTGPIFAIIGLGYTAVRLNLFPREGVRTLSTFVIRFALPALIFRALSERSFSEVFHADYLVAYGSGSLIAFALVFLLALRMRGADLRAGAVYGMGASCSNSIMIGYPIVLQALGPAAMVPFALTLMIENLVMVPLALVMADSAGRFGAGWVKGTARTASTLARNPILLALSLGLLSSASGIQAPEVVGNAIDILAGAVSAVALFAVGGMLVGLAADGVLPDINRILIGKLIVHPVAVTCMIMLLPPMDPVLRVTAIIMACMPMFTIYPVLGQRYGLGPVCAAALVATTVASFVTINALIWLLDPFTAV